LTPEETKIARAFVACSRWQWMPGMLCVKPVGIPGGPHGGMGYQPLASVRVTKVTLHPARLSMGAYDWSPVGCLPDITDPATLGCILRLVRDATGDPGLHLRCTLPYVPSYTASLPWLACSGRGQRLTERHHTEAEALLQVLQAASEAP